MFGPRLKRFREEVLKISQEKLSLLLGMKSQNAVSGYERGERDPSIAQLKILFGLGCDLNWLIGGKETDAARDAMTLRAKFGELEDTFQSVREECSNAIYRCEKRMNKKKP